MRIGKTGHQRSASETMRKVLVFSAGLAIVVGCVTSSQAALIDNFNSGGGSAQAGAGGADTDTSATAAGDALGDFRALAIPATTAVSGIGNLTLAANPLASGLLSFSLDAQTSGSARLTWDANGAGLGGIDLTDAGASTTFTFDILSIDQGLIDLIITVEDTGGNVASRTFSNAGVGQQQTLFSAFTNFGGTDFTIAERVSLEISGRDGSDVTLDQIFTFGQITPVPEPSSLALCITALGGIFMVRRRARGKAKVA